jgi:hypothetical protein
MRLTPGVVHAKKQSIFLDVYGPAPVLALAPWAWWQKYDQSCVQFVVLQFLPKIGKFGLEFNFMALR